MSTSIKDIGSSQKIQKKSIGTVKDVFDTGLKYSEKVINIDSSKTIQQGVQKDTKFINDLLQIEEHARTQDKEISSKRANLTDEQYKFVEQTGKVHYEANIFSQSSKTDANEIKSEDKCKCGCNRAKGQRLPYCINIQTETFFGQGVIMFFYFNLRVFIVTLIVALIYSIFSVVTNSVSDQTDQNCSNPGALAFLCQWKVDSQVRNKHENDSLLIVQLCLGFVACFVWSLGVRLIRRLGTKKSLKIDDLLISSSDFFIFIEKLPIGDYTEKQILRYLKRLWEDLQVEDKKPLKIKGVEIIYDLREFRSKISEIQKLAKKLLSYCRKKKNVGSKRKLSIHVTDNQEQSKQMTINVGFQQQYIQDKKLIGEKYAQVIKYREEFLNNEQFRKNLATQCALVEFQDDKQLEVFVDKYGVAKKTWVKNKIQKIRQKYFNKKTSLFKERAIRIYKAPEPSDIFWAHCQKKVRLRRTVIVWILNLVCSGLSFGALYLLKFITSQNPQIQGLSILSIIGINLFNRLIWNVLLNIVFIEENYTKTVNVISIMNKSYFSQLLNIIVFPIILNYVVNDSRKLHAPTGVAGQAHDFQITAFLFMTLFNLINVPYRAVSFIRFIKPLRRMAIKYFCRITGEFDNYAEMKDAVVWLYDPPLVPFAGLYVYITTVISQAFFFCHLMPILPIYLLGNMILFFFMNKYLVLRMCKITDLIDITVFQHIVQFALNIPMLYAVGSILFLALSEKDYNFGFYVPSILCFVIWFLSVESPFDLYTKMIDRILKCIKIDQKKLQGHRKQYEEERVNQIVLGIVQQVGIPVQQKGKKIAKKSKRMENYYGAIGTNDIFNLQNKLQQVKGPYHGKLKQFCNKFNTELMDKLPAQQNSSKPKKTIQSLESCEIILY